MKKLLFASFFLLPILFYAQNNTIASGEKLVFTASYNMSGFLTDFAQITMETSEVKTSSSTLFRLKCKARTFKKWDNFFKIDDLYESYVSPTSLKPYLFKREINEGSYYKFMQYNYDYNTKNVRSLMRKRNREGNYYDQRMQLPLNNEVVDIVTTVYQIRNLDINKAATGDSDTFSVLMDNETTTIKVTLLGKETINTNIGKKECYKLAVAITDSDLLKGKNDNLLWLTSDKNKIPVYGKFKLAVGNGELKIDSETGLKN